MTKHTHTHINISNTLIFIFFYPSYSYANKFKEKKRKKTTEENIIFGSHISTFKCYDVMRLIFLLKQLPLILNLFNSGVFHIHEMFS